MITHSPNVTELNETLTAEKFWENFKYLEIKQISKITWVKENITIEYKHTHHTKIYET